ncbi:MAG: gluconate 2-dehydrogenase subunit 3 family protein [Thermomicrobiales bacterium]|nr:gluconate 2-dehydrogenase subunit 3 family protein [Thermomicrobiales bacterium]MCO5222253.1 gluconate 2-dehydrogenase subunit 3 family protein [Thermomicrobiales bacterium]
MPGSNGRDAAPERMFPRRELLKGSAGLGGGITALVWGVGAGHAGPAQGVLQWFSALKQATPVASPEAVETYQPIALTEAEATALRAITNRLIPADELGPGAGDAGAFIYIDWTLAGPGTAALPLYQAGIAALDAGAGDGGFAAADSATQDALLGQAEAGELADLPDGFFPLLLEHTRQGMFADPMYGGNIDFAGWDLIQYPGLKLTWTPEEQALGTVVTPAHRSVGDQGGVPYVQPSEITPTGTPVAESGTPVVSPGGTPNVGNQPNA